MSTLRTNTIENAAGTKSVPVNTVVDGSAKAWVNFNGTGTVAIRASFNVTSITDNGTGSYTVNFTNAMPDANYSAVITTSNNATTGGLFASTLLNAYATNSVGCFVQLCTTGAAQDPNFVNVAIFR